MTMLSASNTDNHRATSSRRRVPKPQFRPIKRRDSEASGDTLDLEQDQQKSDEAATPAIPSTTSTESSSSTSTATMTLSTTPKKIVSFGMVQVIEFAMIIGDHPETQKGCPVTLDWGGTSALELQPVRFAEPKRRFGTSRAEWAAWQNRPPPKTLDSFRLPSRRRTEILLKAGYQLPEINEGTVLAETLKKLRLESVKNQKYENYHSFVEVTSRRIKKLVSLPTKLVAVAPKQRPAASKSLSPSRTTLAAPTVRTTVATPA